MNDQELKNKLHKVWHYGSQRVRVTQELIDAGYNFDKKSTPIMKAIEAQINMTRRALGVR